MKKCATVKAMRAATACHNINISRDRIRNAPSIIIASAITATATSTNPANRQGARSVPPAV